MNTIEREALKAALNEAISSWLDQVAGEIILPHTTDNTAAYMAAAALAVLDALEDAEDTAAEENKQ